MSAPSQPSNNLVPSLLLASNFPGPTLRSKIRLCNTNRRSNQSNNKIRQKERLQLRLLQHSSMMVPYPRLLTTLATSNLSVATKRCSRKQFWTQTIRLWTLSKPRRRGIRRCLTSSNQGNNYSLFRRT